ncbi:MAG: flagellar export chaperone FlgN [Armatimonadota bacterium]
MPTTIQLSEALVGCLKDVSSLLAHSHSIALKQRDALVANDAEGIVVTSGAQDEILRRISEADQRAAAVAAELAQSAGLDPESADANALADAAGFPYSQLIRSEMERISTLAETVHKANEINKHLLNNGLEIIACCLRTVAHDPGPSSYSKDAHVASSQAHVLSLDLRV